MAELGYESARDKVIDGYKFGWYGFKKSRKKLLELAYKGWSWAQYNVVIQYTDLKEPSKETAQKIEEFAELGWEWAKFFRAIGYLDGEVGFPKDHKKLEELANSGCLEAKKYWDKLNIGKTI